MKIQIIVASALLALSSCASATRGITEDVRIESKPAGAKITTDLGPGCASTPCSIKAPRNKSFTVTATLKGQTRTAFVDTVTSKDGNNAMAGNIIAGGLIGAAIDSGNGANKDHKPNPVVINF